MLTVTLSFQFDPAVHRYHAMMEYADEFFRPNYRNTKWLVMSVIVPIVILWRAVRWDRDGQEKMIRTGQVAYKDREWKRKL